MVQSPSRPPIGARIEASATALSRVPAVTGAGERFRFTNRAAARADVADGAVVGAGFAADSTGTTAGPLLQPGPPALWFAAVPLPLVREAVTGNPQRAVFRQTAGGRVAMPLPDGRSPLVWTTLELVLHADGRVERRLAGASAFPRHRLDGTDGSPPHRFGVPDVAEWARTAPVEHSPWGGPDSPALRGAVESALLAQVAAAVLRGGHRPQVRALPPGAALTRPGETVPDEVYLLLDGVVAATGEDPEPARLGPGTLIDGRELRGTGIRMVIAATAARVAVAPGAAVDRRAFTRSSGRPTPP